MSKASVSGSLEPHLPGVYRFGLLMTGRAAGAEAVLRHTVEGAARSGITDLRDVQRVKRWLFTEARRQSSLPSALDPVAAAGTETTGDAAPTPAPGPTPADEPKSALPARFLILPEPERCALALFYLFLFDPSGIAEVMEMPASELPVLLSQARETLAMTP